MQIKVRVKAGARRELVKEIAPDRLEIEVREAAEHNAANKRVIAILAARFGVREKDVRFAKGQRSPSKLFTINPGR